MLTLTKMLESGVHYGHKKERSHPKSRVYTFTIREGIFIIDLEKTQTELKRTTQYLKKEISQGKTVLFIGTKRQVKKITKETAEKLAMPFIDRRFFGGTLTNFETIKKSIISLENLENQMSLKEFEDLTKKEKKIIQDKHKRLLTSFGGIRNMKKLPDIVFVIDATNEKVAVNEAIKMNIPVVAISDTDVNPDKLNFLIPANDDSEKAIKLICEEIANELAVKPEKLEKEISSNEKEKIIVEPKKETEINKKSNKTEKDNKNTAKSNKKLKKEKPKANNLEEK